MLATLESATVIGVEACRVHVEIDVSTGIPHFQLVGLPDASVRRAVTACEPPSGIRGSTSPSIGSLLISLPATSGRPVPPSTCRSRSACSPPPASSRAPTSPASFTWASCRLTARFSRREACCRLPPRPAARRTRAAAPLRQLCRSGGRLWLAPASGANAARGRRTAESVATLNGRPTLCPVARSRPSARGARRRPSPISLICTAKPSLAAHSRWRPPAATTS